MRERSLRRRWPWVRLLQGVGLALDGRKLILAALGVVLLWGGWRALDAAFPESAAVTPPERVLLPVFNADEPFAVFEQATWFIAFSIGQVAVPFRALFELGGGTPRFFHALLAMLWALVVWGVFGGAIARVAVVQVATTERIGVVAALRFALARLRALVLAPLGALIGVAVFAAICAVVGLLYRIPGPIGETAAGVLLFVPLLMALVMLVILVGLVVGWPLMVATVAAEGEDAFDALSRSYSYVYQRSVVYAFYVLLAWVVGTIGLVVVAGLARALVHLAAWGLAFGAPDPTVATYVNHAAFLPGASPVGVHGFWLRLVALLAYGWVYSYLWSAAAQIYLLLRHDLDGAPFEDIALAGGQVGETSAGTGSPEPAAPDAGDTPPSE